jgi:D-alanyl-D-alanine carboxypeptidase
MATAGSSGAGAPADVARRLDALLHGLLSRKPLKHAFVAVARGDGSFEWAHALGEAAPDGTPRRIDTPFFIASIDKLLNATIALKLWEAGRLNLDESLAAYLPSDLMRGLHRLGGTDYSTHLTVRHVLGHTSGLPDWLEDRPKGGISLVDRMLRDGDRRVEMDEVAAIVRELTPYFPPQDLSASRPRARYSDTNYMLLVAVLQAVAGRSLESLHEEWLFRPLGMRHTYFAGRSRPLDPTPEPTVLRAGGEPLDIPLLMASFHGMYSTGADLLVFLGGLLRGRLFDDPRTLAMMQGRWNRFGFPRNLAALRQPNWPIEYALGMMRFRIPRIFAPLHPVPAVVGHSGSTGTWLFYCAEWDVLLTGSVDEVAAGAIPYRVVPRMLNILRAGGVAGPLSR